MPRMEAFANRLAQQAQQELRTGNRDDAFLYAEFALQYLHADNADARQALMDAWYCNDVIPEYLNADEKPAAHVPRTLWMPAFGGGSGRGGGWHDDVRFPWSMDEFELTYYVEKHRAEQVTQLPLHPDSAFLSAYSGQTQNRLTVFGDNTAQMHNRAGALLFRFEVADSMEYVKFVGKGKHLLCRKMSGPTELRDAETGKHLLWLEKGCCSGQQLEDSDWYCSARDSVVDLFDLAAGALLRSMPGLGSQAPDARDRLVKYFKAAPGFSTLAAVQNDGTATLFDLKTGKRLSTFSIGENAFPMDFSANGAILGIEQVRQVDDYTEHFSASLWDTYSGGLLASFDFGQERPRAMACAPFGDRVVFLLESRHTEPQRRLAAFNIPDQRPLWTLSGNYADLSELISRRSNLFSEAFWNGHFASPTPAFGEFSLQQTPRLQFSPDGKWLCAAGYAPLMTIKIYEAATGRLQLNLDAPDDPNPALAFSPDSRNLLVGQYKSRSKMASHAEIWDLETMTKRHDLGGQKGPISLVGWSPDGTLAFTHSAGNALVVWDAASGQKRLEPGIPLSYALQAGFSPDGKMLAAIDSGQQLVLCSVPDGKRISHNFGNESDNQLLAFSPDGRYLAVYTADKFVKLWNLQTGKPALELPCGQAYFDRIYFSNDSRLILGSAPGSNTAWDVRTGKKIVEGAERAFDFDPKNNVFAQNRSGNVVFREAFSRQEKARLRGLGYGQGSFSPDGKRFAAIVNIDIKETKQQSDIAQTGGYYQIRLFDFDPDTIRVKARRVERKKALSCEQMLGLLPEKYLDDNSLDTLAGRILRRGDRDCRNCFNRHFAELADQEPYLAKAQKYYAQAILIGQGQEDSLGMYQLYRQRAERYLDAGMPDSAVLDAEKAMRLVSDSRFVQVILLVGQLMQGQYKNVAVHLVENATMEYGDLLGIHFSTTLRRAETGRPWRNDRALQGRIEKCLRLISATDSLDEIDARRYHITPLQFNHIPRAALLAELGLPDSTLAVYKTAMDSIAREATGYIEAPNAYQQSMQAFYDFHYLLADSLMAESVRQMRDSLAGRPDEETAFALSQALHNRSWIAIFAQKPGAAIAAALECQKLDNKNTAVLTNLGHGYLFSGQFDKALETYRAYVAQENAGTSVLLTDFFDLREAGIWSKDVVKALEAILGRALTEEERMDYGQ